LLICLLVLLFLLLLLPHVLCMVLFHFCRTACAWHRLQTRITAWPMASSSP
jgi:hypothetical protein